jgi:hypothetical protein
MLHRAPIPCSLGVAFSSFFIPRAGLAVVIQWCWFGDHAFLELDIAGVDYFILATFFGVGCMVVMSVVMLVLWIQHRVMGDSLGCGLRGFIHCPKVCRIECKLKCKLKCNYEKKKETKDRKIRQDPPVLQGKICERRVL